MGRGGGLLCGEKTGQARENLGAIGKIGEEGGPGVSSHATFIGLRLCLRGQNEKAATDR